ncbi:MAG: hypothetical protein J6386_05300 [Candidatus Synoicihabitans palmerolidicus]|nr:hypothetical protein [Candidatus Synoicihabitans palmerolidicus]
MPTSAIGSRKSAQKSAFLPPFQNQGKWDTLYLSHPRSRQPTRTASPFGQHRPA